MVKHNSNKEGKRIKILFINEDIQPHCPELLYCPNGPTCWHQGAQCLTEAVLIFVGLAASGFVLQPLKEGGDRGGLVLTSHQIDSIFNGEEEQREQALLQSPPDFPFHTVSPFNSDP